MNKKAFSLLELLITMTIVILLSTAIIKMYNSIENGNILFERSSVISLNKKIKKININKNTNNIKKNNNYDMFGDVIEAEYKNNNI